MYCMCTTPVTRTVMCTVFRASGGDVHHALSGRPPHWRDSVAGQHSQRRGCGVRHGLPPPQGEVTLVVVMLVVVVMLEVVVLVAAR